MAGVARKTPAGAKHYSLPPVCRGGDGGAVRTSEETKKEEGRATMIKSRFWGGGSEGRRLESCAT